MKKWKTMDGNTAASHVAYAFTDVAAIYPITPSSPMAENIDEWAAYGRKNIFDQKVNVVELQSEGGASGSVHGSLQSGALTSTFTASQGLLLMVPNMYKISGELLPGVFHVSARAVATHALSIFGDHSDVMATRQTGFALLASGGVQEVMDLGAVAHLASIESRIPFLHFFDGFRTSHEIQKIQVWDYTDLKKIVNFDKIREFRERALNPQHPATRGTAQNPDIFFQARESSNIFYQKVPDIVSGYMKKISKSTGREYSLFNYHGASDAEYVIAAMGSVTDTIEETVDYLNSQGEKVGVIKVHLYRPFSKQHFLEALPKTTKKIAALDRTKEPGSPGEPLYEDIRTVFYRESHRPEVIGGRYGLGSKDTTPSQIKAVFDNLKKENPKDSFTIGIIDDVTHTSLSSKEKIETEPKGTIRCKFWGLGSDGTVGANKNAIKIIGDNTKLYAQGYFQYDSKKSGGLTISHLRFGKNPIKSTYLIETADYVACHNQAYVDQYDLLYGLKDGGQFVLNCQWDKQELEAKLPADMKKYLAENNIDFYIIDATDIAREIGLGSRINMIMQAAFFKISKVIEVKEAVGLLKQAIKDTYGRKGKNIVEMNYKAVDKGIEKLEKIDVPKSWKNAKSEKKKEEKDVPAFIKNMLIPMNRQKGDDIPVSAFTGREDGTFPPGTAAYEKRGIAVQVPRWIKENCIQCNFCSFVCPHSVIRPYLLTEAGEKDMPEDFETLDAKGKNVKGLKFRIQISPLDCTGCENCVEVCPPKNKALEMESLESQLPEAKNWEAAQNISNKEIEPTTVKDSQFCQPLFEFSGSCGGCGETSYAKLVTQLFGDRMLIANATGCSSIWGGSAPSTPYTVNKKGMGPAWANSLFEDNAEYGYGMALGNKQLRLKIETLIGELLNLGIDKELKEALENWLKFKDEGEKTKQLYPEMVKLLSKKQGSEKISKLTKELLELKDYFIKKSIWIFGGDGWAYDIGYGGLDHVLASGEDVNVFVFDTEVYSNTGGQSSKATPLGAVAKFTASGKKTKKKDLGLMATTYGYVYVAQIAMGADKKQTLKAIREAESYRGPSIIIAYSPCISHGIKKGMQHTQGREKEAVDSGYWHLYRYNPDLEEEGKNPFILDSKEPKTSFREFLMGEIRYASLTKTFPEIADKLFQKAEKDAKEKYEAYKKMSEDA
ncbi:MAG: pyruvate:ferredoxin (flavodoxin) oxidoreductase [Actinomycetota bacterium]